MAKTIKHLTESLISNGIDDKLIKIVNEINREDFFDSHFKKQIFTGEPIPAGYGEESDDIFLLLKMIEYLSPMKKSRILEVGTGSGYSTAILSALAKEVVTIEYNETLAKESKDNLLEKGYLNIKFYAGDVTRLEEKLGQFDRVIVYPACVQSPVVLFSMLKNNGIGVYPMGFPVSQQITVYKNKAKTEDITKKFTFHDYCSLKSIRGRYGWVDHPDGYIVDDVDF